MAPALSGAATGPVLAAGGRQLAQAARSGGPVDWDEVRRQFLFAHDLDHSCIPINAANLCPSFMSVEQMVSFVIEELDKNVSFTARGVFADMEDRAKNLIGCWLGVPGAESCDNLIPELLKSGAAGDGFEDYSGLFDRLDRLGGEAFPTSVALTRNTTEGNNIINRGLELHGNDVVVLWDRNHPTNLHAWYYRRYLEERRDPGDVFTIVQVGKDIAFNENPASVGEIVSTFLSLVRRYHRVGGKRVRIVSFSWLANTSGLLIPAYELVDAIKEIDPEILVHLDGAQTTGGLAVDLDSVGADSYAGSFHKWPCGPKMVGLLYAKDAMAQAMTPLLWGYDEHIRTPDVVDKRYDPMAPGYDGALNPDAQRFQYLGQQNDTTLMSLFPMVFEHLEIGPTNIEQRLRWLGDTTIAAVLDRFAAHSLKVEEDYGFLTPHYRPDYASPNPFRLSIVIVTVKKPPFTTKPDESYTAVTNLLSKPKDPSTTPRFALAPENGIRFSSHIYNSEDDLYRAADRVATIVKQMIDEG